MILAYGRARCGWENESPHRLSRPSESWQASGAYKTAGLGRTREARFHGDGPFISSGTLVPRGRCRVLAAWSSMLFAPNFDPHCTSLSRPAHIPCASVQDNARLSYSYMLHGTPSLPQALRKLGVSKKEENYSPQKLVGTRIRWVCCKCKTPAEWIRNIVWGLHSNNLNPPLRIRRDGTACRCSIAARLRALRAAFGSPAPKATLSLGGSLTRF